MNRKHNNVTMDFCLE